MNYIPKCSSFFEFQNGDTKLQNGDTKLQNGDTEFQNGKAIPKITTEITIENKEEIDKSISKKDDLFYIEAYRESECRK